MSALSWVPVNELPPDSFGRGSQVPTRPVCIRVLYFEGCPSIDETVRLVRRIADLPAAGIAVETLAITSQEDAVRHRFLGSPTVQVNGVDIDPSARDSKRFAMACRLYGTSGVPTAGMIATAIREAFD